MKKWLSASLATIVAFTVIYSCSKNESLWDWMIPETTDSTTSAQVQGYIFRPAQVPATDANVAQLKVPSGFKVAKFADSLGKPRILATDAAGHVYVSDREAGTVTLLEDTDADGQTNRKQIVVNLEQAHGLYVYSGYLYITTVKEIYRAQIQSDGTVAEPQLIIDGLPDGGQHPNRTLAVGPDNKLYISVGSTCNSCPEPNKMNATMVRANPDGSMPEIFAKGLRNTIGFGWHPASNEMWGMDHGIDWLGDNEQEEELNQIVQNGNYGWPYIYGDGNYNPGDDPPGDTTYQQYLSITKLPSLGYQAHSAPMQLAFYTGQLFPEEYRNDAFIAMRGSWNRSEPAGYKVVRIHFENGKPVSFMDFLTGFLVDNNKSHFGRLVGVAVHPDGSLLVSDDTNGVIYRITTL